MKMILVKYIYQYSFAVILFFVALVVERSILLPGFSLWLLSYLLLRRVSFKTIFLLGLISDLVGLRMVGVTGALMSVLLIINHAYPKERSIRLWLATTIGVAIVMSAGGNKLGWGYLLESVLFFVLFFFRLPIRYLFDRRREQMA